MKKSILIVGGSLHIRILTSIARSLGKDELSIDALPRDQLKTRAAILKAYTGKMLKLLKREYDILHILFPAHRLSLRLARLALSLRIRVILHWIGSDVTLAARRNYFRRYREVLSKSINVTDAPWLADELREQGIEVSHIVPIVPADIFDDIPHVAEVWPNTFNVIYYLPKGNEEFYNMNLLKTLSREFNEEVKFIVVGTNVLPFNSRNVIVRGVVPREKMIDVYKEGVVLIRMPVYDGLSIMVLEALLAGRYVIYNMPFRNPCVYKAKSEEDVIRILSSMLSDFKRGALKPAVACSRIIAEEYSPQRIGKLLAKLWGLE